MAKSKLQMLKREKDKLAKKLIELEKEIEEQNKQKLIMVTTENIARTITQTSYINDIKDAIKTDDFVAFTKYYRQGDTTICEYNDSIGTCTKHCGDDENQIVALKIAGARARVEYWKKIADDLVENLT